MKNTLSVNLKGCYYGKEFIADDNQNFKIGDKVLVSHYFDNNGNEYNRAKDIDIVKIENNITDESEIESWKNGPSRSNGNLTHYFIGIKTVSRIFKTKIWCK